MDFIFLSVLAVFLFTMLRLRRDVTYKQHATEKNNSHATAHSVPSTNRQSLAAIEALVDQHETASVFVDLVRKDGAGSWPPRANHLTAHWPVALRPYRDVLQEMGRLLPRSTPSLDDEANLATISAFRARYRDLLSQRIDLDQVEHLLAAADAGRWDVVPRDVYNAFYCCIAASRHAYRWATIPVVRVAQLEKVVDLPPQLTRPWTCLQRSFGCESESGNNTSNLVLNFDLQERYVFPINRGLSQAILAAEEAFARIFRDVEVQGVPIYTEMILAIISYTRGELGACATHMERISFQLRAVLQRYFDGMHEKTIARDIWLPHVQGFYAWGVGYLSDADGEEENWVRFDGLSGNQVLLFQALDAFLGIEPYLTLRDRERNVPARQRALCSVLEKHSFRRRLQETYSDDGEDNENVDRILTQSDDILKRLRLFRTVHKTRARSYLSQPAPERLPMTAGKSLLKADMTQSLQFLEGFMESRLMQTV